MVTPVYRLFGRRQDRPLTLGHQSRMGRLLPALSITPDELAPILDNTQHKWLEIGFGGGEHLAWQAAQNPDILMIGAEPFLNGVAKLLAKIEIQELQNIRILHGDVRPLLVQLPDGLLDRLFILHPDPWPKKRHQKRRIVNQVLLHHAARLLKPGCEMRIASDSADYIKWTLIQLQIFNSSTRRFAWTAQEAADWQCRPADWPQTRYEAKALRAGRAPTYLTFIRL